MRISDWSSDVCSSDLSEARTIERALGGGLAVGSIVLKPKRVSSNALDELAGAKVSFVTKGTNYREIASETARRSILPISSDTACTRAGHCVATISSRPRIQLVISRAASAALRLRFRSGLLMPVKDISSFRVEHWAPSLAKV